MKHIPATAASLARAALIFGVTLSVPALAQPVPPAAVGRGALLAPIEVVGIVRSAGLEPLQRPAWQGTGYTIRAMDRLGRHLRVFVDGTSGRIVRVVPSAEPLQGAPMAPPLYGLAYGPAVPPDGYGPASRIAPLAEEEDERGAQVAMPPSPPQRAPVSTVPPAAKSSAATPPLPKPRPKVAASPAASPPTPSNALRKEANGTTSASPAPASAAAAASPGELLE
ncbi:MAG: hypothetical protein ACJ8F3_05235 [Xanthobacteraceae bacterium]